MTHHLELFTHPSCISREGGRQFIETFLKDFPQLTYREVNMVANQKRATALGVRMSPTLVFNDKIIAVGIPAKQTLRMLLEELIHDKTR